MSDAQLLDVNVLLALTWDQHVHHAAAHRQFASVDSWCTTPLTETGLVRLLLTRAVVGRSVTGSEVLEQLAAVRRVHGWFFMEDSGSLVAPKVDTTVLMGRQQVTDLHLVNLAATHGLQLATFDAGMKRSLVPADQHWVRVWST